MNWLCDINWFAIHTKRFRETVAASMVGSLGLQVFLPMIKVEAAEWAVIKVSSKPLFPAYFFARFSPEKFLSAVESARGVLHVIKSGACPIPVDEVVVRQIQEQVEADGLIRLMRREPAPGDRVCIQEGPFAGMLGLVEAQLDDRKRVSILLEALWNARVLIEKRWLELEAA